MRDQQTIDKLSYFFRGDADAVNFALMFTHVADIWDDLVDKDRAPTDNELNSAFWYCLSAMPRNRFYRNHMDELIPQIETGILNWMAADELVKRGGKKEMEVANVIRHNISDLFVHMARLIGGFDWAVQVTADIKMLAQNDTLEEFLKG